MSFLNAQSPLQEWEGVYEGQMIIGFSERENDTVAVTFELLPIIPDSSWTYRMSYMNKRYGKITKDYEILRNGESWTNFLLDEKDGIIIEMTLMNDCFYSVFEVTDQIYSIAMRKVKKNIEFDLFTSTKNSLVTSSSPEEYSDTYEVFSCKPNQHQTVLLKRSKN